ncbi:hypothetical protein CUC00_09490 [Prevotella intermedia]|uniref:Uncharacterized protein n=1 Tax=Prevotella intermedia TaxID=28131 RepID=A0AAJ3V9P2_PREIN|nr:hypothetical protein CTM44_00450 [Prevotella intermedia]ATV41246.1 hypothetical protein CUC00_09490 [Prevotella intermedia]PIK18160.1 hypothetical protein CTI16_03130 [Prevotella intermedia]
MINELQNLLFCIAKAVLLPTKSGCFAMQNSRFYNAKVQLLLFNRIIFTISNLFSVSDFSNKKENRSSYKILLNC